MDLYTKTALTNTRHHDLLAEADAARLAAEGAPDRTPGKVHGVGARLAGVLAAARVPSIVHHRHHGAPAHS